MIAVAAALGDATRNRRAYVAEVEQRAVDAERTREEEARRRVDEERLHIARELHDVTAHSLSIIAVQSGAAAHVIDSNPAEARRALEAIRRTSKDALDDLRAMLGVLRSNDESDAPLAPAPGLERLGELSGPMHDAGVDVTFELGDGLDDLPAVVGSSAYRIVQEALTNVIRHAGPCSATVRVWREDGELAIEVLDNGRGPGHADTSAGHGLAGMRERAVALGGSLSAGAAESGGFRRASAPANRRQGETVVSDRIRVLVADDQALVRGGFRVLVDSASDLETVGEAADGAEALALVRELKPDVVLMDIRMPVKDGIEATREIAADPATAATRVLILTTFDLDEYVYEALRAGASGFLLKDTDPVTLLDAIRVVHSGDALLAPSVTRRLIAEFMHRPSPARANPEQLDVLTEREREVLSHVARGLSNAEIATELFISPATAKTHVSRVMMKLAARDRAQLVAIAYETGLVTAGSSDS